MVHFKDRNEEGLLADRVQLYGMEQFPLDHLTVLEGDLSKLNEPGGRYVAAVYSDDDYGQPEMDSHWARLGRHSHPRAMWKSMSTIILTPARYTAPGRMCPRCQLGGPGREVPGCGVRVAALVTVPMALSYRYYGADEFMMNDQDLHPGHGHGQRHVLCLRYHKRGQRRHGGISGRLHGKCESPVRL
ncbi:MAG: hypothetical protein ACLUJG_09810 [Lawsonibacter sp.]